MRPIPNGGGKVTAKFNPLPHSLNPVKTDWSLTEIQSYVVEALFLHYFKVLQPIKLILCEPEIIRSYSLYAKLKYFCK